MGFRKNIAIAVLLIIIPVFANAKDASVKKQDDDNVYSFDTVTVTATRTSQDQFDMPGLASVIDMDDPSVANASTTEEIFKNEPFVQFTGSARRNGQTPSIRGFDKDAVIVLIDGVRQNFQSEHDGMFFVDPSLLKSVEVLRGPNSALYGSGGLGGVISFETKDASDLLKGDETWGSMFSTGYNSANKEIYGTTSGYAVDESGKWDSLVSLTKRDSSNIELGDDSKLPSQDMVESALTKLKYYASESNSLGISYQIYNNNSKEPNNPQVGFAGPTGDMVKKLSRSQTVKLTDEFDDPEMDAFKLKTQFYYTNTIVREQVVDDTDVNNPGDVLIRDLDTFGFNADAQSFLNKGENLSDTFSYGIEYYTDRQDGSDSRNGERGGVPDADAEYGGAYFQDEFDMRPEWLFGELIFVPAVRFDTYQSSNATGLQNDEQALSPKMGVTYKPVHWFMTYASWADAFRAPTITELYSTGFHFAITGLGINTFTPNPNLRPEKINNKEVGLGFDFEDLFTEKDKLNFKIGKYFTDGKDFIDSEVNFSMAPCCGTTDTVNVPNASLHGTEAQLSYENSRIDFSMLYTSINGKNDDTGEYLGTLTPTALTTNIGFKIPEYDSTIGWRVTGVREHNKVRVLGDVREGYASHDIYYQWDPESMKNLSMYFGIDNIFDRAYATVFPGSLDPGRNYKVQAKYTW